MAVRPRGCSAFPSSGTSSSDSPQSSPKTDSEANSSDVTGTNSPDLTSGSEDEGIYGWILSLIEEGKVARTVDRRRGIYELDWKIVVPRYWFEFREARKRLKSKSVKEIKFDHRNASNTLRASLLNAYKGKGAIEFPEKKVMDSRNRTIKRCFRLPSTMIHKLARHDSTDDDPSRSDSDVMRSLSGYDSSLEDNFVKEIDPCEGPYQGGNAAFIFLQDSLHRRFGADDNMHTCKVVFCLPSEGLLAAHAEVTATVKNCFTIKVFVPHCPSTGLSVGQLACGKLTVQVLVSTLEGHYIGETVYTYMYSASREAQLQQIVKALGDGDMDHRDSNVSSTDGQHVALNYTHPDLSGPYLFDIASLRALVFVAVKEKAFNFLSAFLDSPAALPVLQQCKDKLLSFLDHVRRSDRENNRHISVSVLDMCEKLIQEHKAAQQSGSAISSPGIQGSASEEEKEQKTGYDSSSEFETHQELEALTNEWRESAVLEPNASGPRCENNEYCLNVEHRNATREGNEEGKDNPVEPTFSLNLAGAKSLQVKEGKREVDNGASNKTKIFVLRKPCSPVPISRSRASFPDPRTDIFVELQVRKSQRALDDTEETGEHVTVTKQHVTEHIPVTKHHVIVDVRYSETEQSAKDWESKYVKRVSGKLGYWFRFYQPNCELLLVFTLCDKPRASTKPETKPKSAACNVLDHVTVVVKTTNWKGPFSKEAKAEKEPCRLALTCEVPLVTLSRSQNKLCEIMNGLHKLCDNGDWTRFEKECVNLQRHSTSADIQVAILLEKAIAFLYQHDLEKAELTALEALKIASESENHQLLAGRAYYYLAHVYRRERKLGEAERCIDLSKQNLHLIDVCLDQSFMAYEEGNVMKDFVSGGAVLRKTLLLRAKQCFERCLDLSRRLDDSDSSVIPPTHSFALIKIAMLLLDCGSTSGRERCVSSSHIQEAERFLELLQKQGLAEITERRKIQFLLARSDLQYRMNNYQTAIRDAETALEKAKELGFMLEVMPARNRLNHICQLLDSGGCVQYTDP